MTKAIILLVILSCNLLLPAAHAANECDGVAYQNTGQSCRSLGLDSNQAICRANDNVAMLCDDRKGGWVRTCSSGVSCGNNQSQPANPKKGSWNGDYVFYKGDWRHCSTLRFNKKRHPIRYCNNGRSNPNCSGKCQSKRDSDYSEDNNNNYNNNYNNDYGNDYSNDQNNNYNQPSSGSQPRNGTWDGNFVFYRGQWQKCSALRFDNSRRPTGFCDTNRRNSNCKGRCEGWSW
ncbi:MAG: hypothetical protein ACI8P9_002508 [Parasphingorhabdus sp.]|jgi:hypothetical protein